MEKTLEKEVGQDEEVVSVKCQGFGTTVLLIPRSIYEKAIRGDKSVAKREYSAMNGFSQFYVSGYFGFYESEHVFNGVAGE
jgi:hypothetical protein